MILGVSFFEEYEQHFGDSNVAGAIVCSRLEINASRIYIKPIVDTWPHFHMLRTSHLQLAACNARESITN